MSGNNYKQFLTVCECGAYTSKQYARAHGGKCKACVTGQTSGQAARDAGRRAYENGEGSDKCSPDMYSHMGGACRGDDLGHSPDY